MRARRPVCGAEAAIGARRARCVAAPASQLADPPALHVAALVVVGGQLKQPPRGRAVRLAVLKRHGGGDGGEYGQGQLHGEARAPGHLAREEGLEVGGVRRAAAHHLGDGQELLQLQEGV